MRAPSASLLTLVSVVALSGCIDDLPAEQVVLDTRVIAARMEVDGEPERAWPRPDESGVLRFRVVNPTDTASVGWGFVICPAAVTPTGLKTCVGSPLDIVIQETPTTDVPEVPVLFPAAALEGVDDVLLTGVFCPGGSPSIDIERMDVTCVGGDEPRQLVNYSVRIERDGAGNRNPTVPADALTFAGAPWNEPTSEPPATGCMAMAGTAELPLASRASPGTTGTTSMGEDTPQELITITGDQADRETYTRSDGEEAEEDLVFAHYATAGEPTRHFSVIDDASTESELKWSYPEASEIASDGTLVRFYVVLVDQRGGTDWTTRHLCMTP